MVRAGSAKPALRRQRKASTALAGAAFLFGSTFLVVKDAVSEAEPVPFLAVRFGVAAAVLWPLARRRPGRPGEVHAGLAAGVALGAGYLLQTAGLQDTSSSTSAFITYLLVVIVPLLSAVVLRRPPHRVTVVGLALAVAGLALLTGGGDAGFGRGEALTLGCAVAFAAHIVVLAQVAPEHDPVRLTFIQLLVVGGGCLLPGFALGGYQFAGSAWLAAVGLGVCATALAFVLQVWAQARVGPTRTALLLLLEPVFAAVLGYVAGERLGIGGLAGAVLILAAIVVSEVLGPVLDRRVKITPS
ncbi:DMT family transporter [soil metagenome]